MTNAYLHRKAIVPTPHSQKDVGGVEGKQFTKSPPSWDGDGGRGVNSQKELLEIT